MIIREGDTVRVLVPGKFEGQVVKVIKKIPRKTDIDYKLATTWDGTPRPSWFGHKEIEKVTEQKRESEEK